jgi:VanZ family protein
MYLHKFLRYWVPVILWMTVIFVASTDLMSGTHTSRFIGPFLRWLSPEISAETIAALQLLIRKAAHVTEYAVLAGLLLRAVRAHGTGKFWQIGLVLMIASLSATLDEFHQSFVASRTGSPSDVLIDVCGAVVGLVTYWSLLRRNRLRVAASAKR